MVLDAAEHLIPQLTKLSEGVTNAIQKVSNTGQDYNFYQNPEFHVSILKLNGLTQDELSNLETHCQEISASESDPDKLIEMEVKSVLFKSGDQFQELKLY